MIREERIAAFDDWAKDKTYGEVYGDFPVNDPDCQTNPVVIWMHSVWDTPWVDVPAPRVGPPMDSAMGLAPMTACNAKRQPPFRPAFWYALFDDAKRQPAAAYRLALYGQWEADGYASGLSDGELMELSEAIAMSGAWDAARMLRKIAVLHTSFNPLEGVETYADDSEFRALVENGIVTDVLRLDRIPNIASGDWRAFETNLDRDTYLTHVVGREWVDEVFDDHVVRTYTLTPIRDELKAHIEEITGR